MYIYFSDLTKDAQKRLLDEAGVKSPKEMNWDENIIPVTEITFEEMERESTTC